jgi:AcrR family transcriptional regulator
MSPITARDPEHTRQQLLQAAADEIHEHGFQAASLDRILGKTKVTKGALYHHFPSKHALGLAVVDEVIGQRVQRWRIDAVSGAGDPFEAILSATRGELDSLSEIEKKHGCPLNNLIQEMSPLDPEFRDHLQAIVKHWQAAIVEVLLRGQERNFLRKDVDCNSVAWFILAVHFGVLGLSKVMEKQFLVEAGFQQAQMYFKSLRP